MEQTPTRYTTMVVDIESIPPSGVMNIYGRGGWREVYGGAIVPSDASLRYIMTEPVRDELVRQGVLFTIGTRLLTDQPQGLMRAVLDIFKTRARDRVENDPSKRAHAAARANLRAVNPAPATEPTA